MKRTLAQIDVYFRRLLQDPKRYGSLILDYHQVSLLELKNGIQEFATGAQQTFSYETKQLSQAPRILFHPKTNFCSQMK
ncbi:Hypothetical predicted protein [Octopus vulgaris]|uniref:Uncharacterized protein n=1 Tax=Octopus vulgaris TaxID=6645 RepID=A0AA36AQL6_OCTVU|nr:Hypothetical predicted protein [Octopus vulgaris]